MQAILKHFAKHLVAGVVALLPVGGTVLGIVYLEATLAGAWRAVPLLAPYYFPGLGMLATATVLYLAGLVVSTFVGRLLLRLADAVLDRLPLLGMLYQTLKQILGYGEGGDAVFVRAVYVQATGGAEREIGLVTREFADRRCVVFVPTSPTPTQGRLIVVDSANLTPFDGTVHDAMKTLVALGKVEAPPPGA